MNEIIAGQVLACFGRASSIEQILRLKSSYQQSVYRINTSKEVLIVKQLKLTSGCCDRFGSDIPEAYLSHWLEGEVIAKNFSEQGIAAVSAYDCDESNYCMIDGQCYFLYPYVVGDHVNVLNMQLSQCREIGALLQKLHQCRLQLSAAKCFVGFEPNDDWHAFVKQHYSKRSLFGSELLLHCQSYLPDPSRAVISHRDITPDNLLWGAEGYYLIDWELAGWIDPQVELLAVALDFSLQSRHEIDQEKFTAVLQGYGEHDHLLQYYHQGFYGVINIWLRWTQYLLRIGATISGLLYA